MKYEVTYTRTMSIEADSESEAIDKAIVNVSENCADGIGYTAHMIVEGLAVPIETWKRMRKQLPVTKEERKLLKQFLLENGCTDIKCGKTSIEGWLSCFHIEVLFNTDNYRFKCVTDGFLPNCPEKDIGKKSKHVDSVLLAKVNLKSRIDDWNRKQSQ